MLGVAIVFNGYLFLSSSLPEETPEDQFVNECDYGFHWLWYPLALKGMENYQAPSTISGGICIVILVFGT